MKQQSERLIIVALLVVICFLALRTCQKKEQEVSSLTDVVKAQQDTIRKQVDDAGREHGQKLLAEADLSSIRAVYQVEIDSLKEILKIKDSQIKSYAAVSTENTGTVIPKVDTVYLPDSSRQFSFDYNDQWLKLQGLIGPAPEIKYSITDSLGITVYNRRKNWLSRAQTFIDVYSVNPRVKVTGLTGFQIKTSQSGRIGIGPYVGYGLTEGKWRPSIGVSVQYSIIRF